jgi:hypothetical protein
VTDDEESTVRNPHTVVLLTAATLLLVGVAACENNDQPSALPSASALPSSAPAASASTTSAPSASLTPSGTATSAPSPESAPAKAFPLTVTRSGGFAGVDDRVLIKADGSVVVTRQGQAPVRTTLPATTMADLRRLLTSPEFTGRTSSPDAAAVCNDGYQYEFTSPSGSATVQDCGTPHGATMDRMLAIVAKVLQG